jgi:MFS family permease
MERYLALLRSRPQYRRLWSAYAVSLFGDWFNTVAAVTIVNRYTDTGTALSLLLITRFLPPFIMGPIAGVVADRFERKQVLLWSNILRLVIVVGILFVDRPERVWIVFLVSALQFIVSAFYEPAQAAIIPDLVEKGEVVRANTLINTTWSAMAAIGSAAGGLIAAVLGTSAAIIIDAATFGVAALIVGQISIQPTIIATPLQPTSGLQDFIAGLTYLKERPRVAVVALVKAMSQFGSIDIMAALYAERVFRLGQDGAGSFGLLLGAFGTGAVLGPLIADQFGEDSVRKLQRSIGVGFILIPVGWLLLGWAPVLPVAMLALLLRGAGGSINWTYSSAVQQLKVPGHFLGRVFSIDFGIFTLVLSLSTLATGWFIDAFGVSPRTVAFILAVGSIPSLLAWVGFLLYDERNPADPSLSG